MALVVEDGSGKTDAESYISEADADTYMAAYKADDSTWTGAAQAAKENALRRATQFIDTKFQQRWLGQRSNEDQVLDWPRGWVVDHDGYSVASDSIPTVLAQATAELAFHAVSENLLADVGTPGTVRSKRERVGPIEVATVYTAASQSKMYSLAERLLSQFISPPGEIRRG